MTFFIAISLIILDFYIENYVLIYFFLNFNQVKNFRSHFFDFFFMSPFSGAPVCTVRGLGRWFTLFL